MRAKEGKLVAWGRKSVDESKFESKRNIISPKCAGALGFNKCNAYLKSFCCKLFEIFMVVYICFIYMLLHILLCIYQFLFRCSALYFHLPFRFFWHSRCLQNAFFLPFSSVTFTNFCSFVSSANKKQKIDRSSKPHSPHPAHSKYTSTHSVATSSFFFFFYFLPWLRTYIPFIIYRYHNVL